MFGRRRSRTRKKFGPAPLKMTSMMDILVVLLLFLIKSFVADGQMTPAAGVQLPASSSEELPDESIVVAVFDDAILVGEERVASITEELSESDLRIDGLADRLIELYDQKMTLAARRGIVDPDPGSVTIQGDRDIEFEILQKVMYTVGEGGFDQISLAVIRTT